jgi:hypothetical protein
MPAIDITHRNLEPVASPATASTKFTSGYPNDTTTFTTLSTSPNLDTSDTTAWSIPVIIGVILTIIAIVVGVPSAMLALQEIRRRRRAHTDNNAKVDDINPLGSIYYNTGTDINTAKSSLGLRDGLHISHGIPQEDGAIDGRPRCLLIHPIISKELEVRRRNYIWHQPRLQAKLAFSRAPQRYVHLRGVQRLRRRLRRACVPVCSNLVRDRSHCGGCGRFARGKLN